MRAGAVSLVGGVEHCSTAALLQPSYLVLDPVKLQPGLQLQAERGDGGDLQQGRVLVLAAASGVSRFS